ncbi:hypothetical protein CFOL_v3_23144, partial [Cephalotus follicularis]
LPSFCVF